MTTSRNRKLIPPPFADLSKWPAPDEELLSKEDRIVYVARKRAVEMYASGVTIEGVTAATSIIRDQIFILSGDV